MTIAKRLSGLIILLVPLVAFGTIKDCELSFSGCSPASGIGYAPFGYHWLSGLEGEPQRNNANHIIALNYQSFQATTYIGSSTTRRERIFLAGLTRDYYRQNGFALGYFVGVSYGYHGRIFRNAPEVIRPLFETNVTPWAFLNAKYHFVDHVAVFGMATYNYASVGLKLTL